MKKILLIYIVLYAIGISGALAQDTESWTIKIVEPLQVTNIEEGKFPKYEYPSKQDSINYEIFEIDTGTLFYRCNTDTMLVGYVLVATKFWDTLFYRQWISWNNSDNIRLKKQISITDVQKAEDALAKQLSSKNLNREFSCIIKRYSEYGRQYLFYYNEYGDECVLINSSCEKYDWLFSRRYNVVSDGGQCYWKIKINLSKDELIDYRINGPGIWYPCE